MPRLAFRPHNTVLTMIIFVGILVTTRYYPAVVVDVELNKRESARSTSTCPNMGSALICLRGCVGTGSMSLCMPLLPPFLDQTVDRIDLQRRDSATCWRRNLENAGAEPTIKAILSSATLDYGIRK
jgi:hypothetical protein